MTSPAGISGISGISGIAGDLPDIRVAIQWAQRHDWEPKQALRRLSTPVHALWLVEAGAIDVTLRDWPDPDRRHWRVPAGMAFLAPAPIVRDVVACASEGASWRTLGLQVTRGFSSKCVNLLETLQPPHLWRPSVGEAVRLEHWMGVLIETRTPNGLRAGSADALLCDGLARAIAAALWQRLAGSDTPIFSPEDLPRQYPAWITETLARADRDSSLSISDLACAAGMSIETFRRSFRRAVGESPQKFLLRRRLSSARSLLVETDESVLRIALSTGFVSQAHFTRRYREVFGLPPAEYRAAQRVVGV